MALQQHQRPNPSQISGEAPLSNSKSHAGLSNSTSLKERMLWAANLVAEDATRQCSPRALAKACGIIDTSDSGSSCAVYDDEGETYLLIRQAFCEAFDELIKQMQGGTQSIMEDLWAALADYLDRMHARQDVAFNDATVQFAITAELERQLRLANARYKEIQHELNHVNAQMAALQKESAEEEASDGQTQLEAPAAGDATPAECTVPIPQPAEDRSVLGLVQHQVPLTPCGGEATSPIHSADSRRSQRSAALMRLANEGLMIDTKLPQTMALALAGPSVEAQGTSEASPVSAQQQGALAQARAEAVQHGILKDERERALARQRGIMHQLQEQLESMRRRTACIDTPIQLRNADSECSPSQSGSNLSPASHTAVQGGPPQSAFEVRNMPARPTTEVKNGPETHSMQQPVMRSPGVAVHGPMSIAQKAGMNVWSRHGLRYRRGLQQAQRERSIPGPEDVPLSSASSGPLAQGLAAAAAEGRRSPASSRKPRHMLLSTSVDTVLGDVFADTSTASETIAAEPQHGFMNFVRSSKGHIGAYSTPRLSQPEAENASMFAQSAARLPLHPEQIALALAEQPSAQPLVSGDILSPLTSPADARQLSGADVSMTAPAALGARRRAHADLYATELTQQHQSLYSPQGIASPMQHARASIQQWGKPRGGVLPQSESMVICGPTWSFPVETASPAVTRSSSREAQTVPCPAHGKSTAAPVNQHEAMGSGFKLHDYASDKGKARMPDLAVQPDESSISFRCRQVTASLPDMVALQAAIRGQPKPQQPDTERLESRLLPDVAVTGRARTLQAVQAAAEQVSASWAPSEHVPEQETKQAAWPLKKGAWDRIQQGAKTVKPDRWHVNEAAGMVSDSAGLQAALSVGPKQTSFEQAANAAVAAIANPTYQGSSTAAAVSTHSVKREGTSASGLGAQQPDGQTEQPLTAQHKAQSKASASAVAAAPKAVSKQNDLSMGKSAGDKHVRPEAASASDAAASKAVGKPHAVAQRLLARANCFAASAQSPAKDSSRAQPLSTISQPAPFALSPAKEAKAKEGTPIQVLSATTQPAAACVFSACGVKGAQESIVSPQAQDSAEMRTPPAMVLSPGSQKSAGASTLVQLAQAEKPLMEQPAQMEAPLKVSSPEDSSSAEKSSPSTITQRRRARLFGESTSNVSLRSAVGVSQDSSSSSAAPSNATMILRTSDISFSSKSQALSATVKSAHSRTSSLSKASSHATEASDAASIAPLSVSSASKQFIAGVVGLETAVAKGSGALSIAARSMSSAGKQSTAGPTLMQGTVAEVSAQEMLRTPAGKTLSAASQENPSPARDTSVDSDVGGQTPAEKKSPQAKSLQCVQQSPPSFDINVTCQMSSVTVSSAGIITGAASQQLQAQTKQQVSGSKVSPAAIPAMLWPGQKLFDAPAGNCATPEEQQTQQRASPTKASPVAPPAILRPAQQLFDTPAGKSAVPERQQQLLESPQSKSTALEKQAESATHTPSPAAKAGLGAQSSSPEKDPLEIYSASVDSARKTAQAAADRLDCLPASPQSSPRDSEATTDDEAAMDDEVATDNNAATQMKEAVEDEEAADESRSVSDIQFSSDSDADEEQSSFAAGHSATEGSEWGGSSLLTTSEHAAAAGSTTAVEHSQTEDSEWGGTSLLTTGKQAVHGDGTGPKSAETTRPSSAEEMYTAGSEAFQAAVSETGTAAPEEDFLAAQVEESISKSTEALLQTASDEGLTEEMTHAELGVTCTQFMSGTCHADSSTEDRELDAMLASVLGTGKEQPIAQSAQEALPAVSDAMLASVLGGMCGQPGAQEEAPAISNAMLASVLGSTSKQPGAHNVQDAAPAVSAAEVQHAEPPAETKPTGESAVDGGSDMTAFHLPDNLFGSPLAGGTQSTHPFGTKKADTMGADSGNEDDGTFIKKPVKKDRKGRRAGRR